VVGKVRGFANVGKCWQMLAWVEGDSVRKWLSFLNSTDSGELHV
jgi:hypothetical protein